MPDTHQPAAKGAEQTFFADPALDRAFGVIMGLAAETWILKDRLRSLEVLLTQARVIEPSALNHYRPDAQEAATLAAEREAFVRALLEVIKGQEASLGAPADLLQRPAT